MGKGHASIDPELFFLVLWTGKLDLREVKKAGMSG